MRSAILAACAWKNPHALGELVRISTRITHTDPRAEEGALAVALAARAALEHGGQLDSDKALAAIRDNVAGKELSDALESVQRLVREKADAPALTQMLGIRHGVSGYINQTVPVALFCWARWPGDFRTGIETVIGLGGDTDTTAAITGALIGGTAGVGAIPAEWIDGMMERPRSVKWLRRLANALTRAATSNDEKTWSAVPLFWPGLLPRNLLFLLVVLLHGFRRQLPPY